jgi:hypothetical protein
MIVQSLRADVLPFRCGGKITGVEVLDNDVSLGRRSAGSAVCRSRVIVPRPSVAAHDVKRLLTLLICPSQIEFEAGSVAVIVLLTRAIFPFGEDDDLAT